MRLLAAAAIAICLPWAVMAQEFEVASVKISAPPGPGMRFGVHGGPGTNDPGTMSWFSTSPVILLATAYSVPPQQISGPGDFLRGVFDITAKLPPGTTRQQVPEMLRKLLEERFHLKTHAEFRNSTTYLMTIAKAGPKLKPAHPDARPPADLRMAGAIQVDRTMFPVAAPGEGATLGMRGSVRFDARAVTAAKLADLLTPEAGRPVIDQTGLAGVYDVRIAFSPEPGGNQAPPPPGAPGPSMSGPDAAASIFTVLQEDLGLRLVPGKAPVKFIVIDHMDKTPTGN